MLNYRTGDTQDVQGITSEDVLGRIDTVLNALGETKTDSVPYDTAWVARLAPRYPGWGFEAALDWLREQQLDDGSWGGRYVHYHDRFVCTLASLIALRDVGDGQTDEERIAYGQDFLWREIGRLSSDAWDTVGFPVLAVALVNEAKALALDVPDSIYHNVAVIEKKLNMLGSDPSKWRYTSLSFSMEATFPYVQDHSAFDDDTFLVDNGSVGASPSATAAYLLRTSQPDPRALEYLRREMDKQDDGGVSDMNPAEVFEITWTLHPLRLAKAVLPNHPDVRRHLATLARLWQRGRGIGFSEYFLAPDLDDTAVGFTLLRWGGYDVESSVFESFEGEDRFHCYPGEAGLSLSVNLRTLAAIQLAGDHPRQREWTDKICQLMRRHDLDNLLWLDKWHISPYYLTGTAICSPAGLIDDLLQRRVQWMLKTQNADGGWGYFGESSYEETAYSLLALLHWNRYVTPVDAVVLDAAADFLVDGMDAPSYPRQYIAKSLFTPYHVVRATILSALYSYLVYKGRA